VTSAASCHHQGDAPAAPAAQAHQKVGEPVGVAVHFFIGESFIFKDEECPFGMLAGLFFEKFCPGHVFEDFLCADHALQVFYKGAPTQFVPGKANQRPDEQKGNADVLEQIHGIPLRYLMVLSGFSRMWMHMAASS
jgi:hypothetical protein